MALENHIVDHLLETAELLLRQTGTAEMQHVLRRRAISSSYYAVFQALCFVFTDGLSLWGAEDDIVEPVFRSLEHKLVKNKLSASRDPDLRAIGLIFARLQEARHAADYASPSYKPTEADTKDVIHDARTVVDALDSMNNHQRRRLAVLLVAKPR